MSVPWSAGHRGGCHTCGASRRLSHLLTDCGLSVLIKCDKVFVCHLRNGNIDGKNTFYTRTHSTWEHIQHSRNGNIDGNVREMSVYGCSKYDLIKRQKRPSMCQKRPSMRCESMDVVSMILLIYYHYYCYHYYYLTERRALDMCMSTGQDWKERERERACTQCHPSVSWIKNI